MNVKEERRNSLIREAFQVDAEIRKLQDHIKDLLQRAVNMDMQQFGYVEKITMDSVDAFNYAISDSKSHELYPKDWFADGEAYHLPDRQSSEKSSDAESRYITYARLDNQEQDTVLEGNDLGELFAKWKEMESERDEQHKIGYVFVIDNTADAHPTRKYEIKSGKDVTPVYLKFPEMSGDDTQRVTQWLKENGAGYNEKRNLWYIGSHDSEQFIDHFRQFIQESQKRTRPEPEKSAEEKKYYSYRYNADGSMARFTGSSIEAVTKHWQEASSRASGRGQNDTPAYFYIREKNADTGQLGEAVKYETATGKDITPIYLNLPHMSRENFAKTTLYLKENGAKFSSTKKLWYVTKDQNLDKFERFLHPESRESTVRKLTDCKKEIAMQAQNSPVGEKKYEAAR